MQSGDPTLDQQEILLKIIVGDMMPMMQQPKLTVSFTRKEAENTTANWTAHHIT